MKTITRDIISGVLMLGSVFLLFTAQVAYSVELNIENEKEKPEKPDNSLCLGCHGMEGFASTAADGSLRPLHIIKDGFSKSVHADRSCVDCHKDILEFPHRTNVERKVGCVQCHRELWDNAKKTGVTAEFERLGVVINQIDSYMGSIHARPNIEDQSRTNATCYDCHDAHYISSGESMERVEHRLQIHNVCGRCHEDKKAAYITSVHGKEVIENENINAATCIDCHMSTMHDIDSPKQESIRLAITKNCGSCHTKQLKTYMWTYHGQVNRLGYAYTAKCFDCHGSHSIQRVDDPASSVHLDNRLETCQKCHEDASEGFISFYPHGNTHDYDRYPSMWIASKFMIWLLAGVFTFFWSHAALWFYREYQDRKQHKLKPHIDTNGLPEKYKGTYYRRFGPIWRIAHLLLALGVMLLVLTGMTVLYADSFWAPTVMKMLGGAQVAAILHRIGAVIFISIFFGHLIFFAFCIGRNWKEFKWFGPKSLLPNWKDLSDVIAMFKWFFNKGPRPVFDRWTYWEKFDYWAPFWGLTIVGVSGAMMWFPGPIATYLPGWAFNVATIVHGEEAFLAAVFLFTVHYFNSHFRPDKFPQDIVMFTGAVPLEEFRHEHTLEYQRLLESGKLDDYIVHAPSQPLTTGSKILGATLIVAGLLLLTFVLLGFWGNVLYG